MKWRYAILGGTAAAAAATTVHDLIQTKHAIVRNFPVIGPRPLLPREVRARAAAVHRHRQRRGAPVQPRPAALGLRQLQAGEQLLRLRHRQRRRGQVAGYPIIKHRTFTGPVRATMPHAQEEIVAALRQGDRRGRAAGRTPSGPDSVVNISGMSFGSLSGKAIEALNKGAATGRLPAEHRRGRAVAATTATAATSSSRSARPTSAAATSTAASTWRGSSTSCSRRPVRAIEIKLSQGAKPGLGGMLPGREGEPRRSPRSAASRSRRGLRLAEPARASSTTSTRCSTSSSWWRRRPGCRSGSSRPSATWTSGTS